MNPKQTRISILTIILMIVLLGAVVVLLDVPPAWGLAIFFVLSVIALMLSRRRAPRGSNRLLLGLLILSICGALMVNAYLAVEPDIPEDLPEEVLSLPPVFDVVPTNAERFVVFYTPEGNMRLRIQFENISALEGHWAYEDAWVDADNALRGTYDADPRERAPTWGDTIYTDDRNPSETVTPEFTVELPIEDKHLYDEIELDARMIVSYPEESGEDEYEINERRASRDIVLFVASPDDRILRQQYDSWIIRSSFLQDTGLLVLGGVAFIGLALTLWGIAKIRAAGGYGIIVPALLGKLGAVVADTSLIPKQQLQEPLPKGVIVVGKIRPSSPAERARLLPGDVIVEADGKPIDSHNAAIRVVEKWKRGEDHTLVIVRDQQNLQVFLQM